MKYWCIQFLTIIFFATVFNYTFAQKQVKKYDVHVVLLAGQSNMVGAGNYYELDPETKQRIVKASKKVSLSYNGKTAQPLSYYNNTSGKQYNFSKRFGLELMLGATLSEAYPHQEFLFIKRAHGGTSLYGAWNPKWDKSKVLLTEKTEYKQQLKLYDLHISDINQNLEYLKKQSKSYKIIGLGWMQGESDTNNAIAAKKYKNGLKELVNAYRTDLNVPQMPFVLGQINALNRKVENGVDVVRTGMKKFVEQDYFSELVETSTDTLWNDYPKHKDNLHYNTEGLKRLGIAFANGFFDIQKRLNVDEFESIEQLKPGETIKFKAEGDTNMMYHVYTPSNFETSKKRPLIIAFSPGGNGLGILNKMKASVEKMGWILVGCDMLKNGMKNHSLEQKMEDELLNAIFKNIPHNTSRVYLSGFSGGAMRSYQLTTRRNEKFAGILAYGGWLGGDTYQDKPYQKGMRIAQVNGIKDMGANKWKDIDAKTLKKHQCTVKHFSHEGGHQVAPESVSTMAMEWLASKK
ncbi:sialate O-acetylesterase [Flavivirga amylovorans]|uniref:Sialate O-acetylesterase n=1 Tax=Flavivirga amylovorans TaxID=870486 RepID=A0ABT8WW75_9FLAO|nr:sialate O-acetylesterase [Flavivirga amylovorans]MDO5985857.1 sialate O-acetylesterase [Flavivirga amylovorans]